MEVLAMGFLDTLIAERQMDPYDVRNIIEDIYRIDYLDKVKIEPYASSLLVYARDKRDWGYDPRNPESINLLDPNVERNIFNHMKRLYGDISAVIGHDIVDIESEHPRSWIGKIILTPEENRIYDTDGKIYVALHKHPL